MDKQTKTNLLTICYKFYYRSMHRAELASIHSQIQSAFLVVETAKYSEVSGFIESRILRRGNLAVYYTSPQKFYNDFLTTLEAFIEF